MGLDVGRGRGGSSKKEGRGKKKERGRRKEKGGKRKMRLDAGRGRGGRRKMGLLMLAAKREEGGKWS